MSLSGIWLLRPDQGASGKAAVNGAFGTENDLAVQGAHSGGASMPANPRASRPRDADTRLSSADAMAQELILLSEGEQLPLETMEELARFDSRQIQRVISIIVSSPELDTIAQAEASGFLLPVLARIDPAKALDLRVSFEPLFKDHDDILPMSKLLETVAASDPAVAEEWRARHLSPGD